MRTFPAAFASELAKKTGITPIWILRLVINGTTYDLSDTEYVFPAGMANGFTATLGWVSQWGEVRESISGNIGEMLVSDFACTVLVDQDASKNIRSLALAYPLEQSPAELYLWLDGLDNTVAPQKLFVGYVKDIDIPDETQVHLTIEDESTRLQKYLGTRISSEAYPLCDPDVVGKVVPIVYGSVPKLPALCVDSGWVSSLVNGISATDTSFKISEVPKYSLQGKIITVDDEQMLVAQPTPPADTSNYASSALGAVATASSYNTPFPATIPGAAIDASTATYWQSGAAPSVGSPQWLQVDFSAPRATTQVGLQLATVNMLKDFTFQIWSGGAWVTIGVFTNNTSSSLVCAFTPQTFSRFRLYITACQNNALASIYNIVTTPAPEPPQPYVQSDTLPVVRGQNGTTAVPHDKGAVVIEKKTTPLVYLCADHSLDVIGTIMARIRGVNVDITADCTKYLGTAGNQLPAYPGKAAITIPDYATVMQKISLALQGDVTGSDAGHAHAAVPGGTNTVTTSQNATGTSTTYNSGTLSVTGGSSTTYSSATVYTVNFPSVPGAITAATATMTVTININNGTWFIMARKSGDVAATVVSPIYTGSKSNFSVPLTLGSHFAADTFYLVVETYAVAHGYSSMTYSGYISAANRSVTYNPGAQTVTVVAGPANVTISNTLQLTGNSVSDVMIGDAVLVDCTRNITAPASVIGNLLSTYCNDATLMTVGTFPASYALNGAITEYKRAIEWLDYLSFQARAYYRKMAGVSRLIVRDVNPAPIGEIAACCLSDEGIKALSYKKAPLTDVINKVKVLYSRDWSSTSKQAEAYAAASAPQTDLVSIANFGELEQPDLFMFDFVTSAVMANDLATFYCDFYGDRKWRISFQTFLDQARFEFGDIVTVPFVNDLAGTLVEAGIAPGSLDQIDKINFVIETAIIPVLDSFALTTLLGDQLMTKTREGLIYV